MTMQFTCLIMRQLFKNGISKLTNKLKEEHDFMSCNVSKNFYHLVFTVIISVVNLRYSNLNQNSYTSNLLTRSCR